LFGSPVQPQPAPSTWFPFATPAPTSGTPTRDKISVEQLYGSPAPPQSTAKLTLDEQKIQSKPKPAVKPAAIPQAKMALDENRIFGAYSAPDRTSLNKPLFTSGQIQQQLNNLNKKIKDNEIARAKISYNDPAYAKLIEEYKNLLSAQSRLNADLKQAPDTLPSGSVKPSTGTKTETKAPANMHYSTRQDVNDLRQEVRNISSAPKTTTGNTGGNSGAKPNTGSNPTGGNPSGVTTTAPNFGASNRIYGGGNLVGQNPDMYGYLETGNAISPWKDIAERNAANAAWVAQWGLDPSQSRTFTIGGNGGGFDLFSANGAYGADGTGGIFNPLGFSSNPYYLQGQIGVSRDQLKGTALEGVSDAALNAAYQYDGYRDNLYVTPDGKVTSIPSPDAVSISAIRKVLAPMTGQQAYYKGDMIGGLLAPLAKPNFYNPANSASNNLGAAQQQAINQWLTSLYAEQALPSTTPPTVPPTTPPTTPPTIPQTLYDLLLKYMVPVSEKKNRGYYNSDAEMIGG
jgi:hypothetical protein